MTTTPWLVSLFCRGLLARATPWSLGNFDPTSELFDVRRLHLKRFGDPSSDPLVWNRAPCLDQKDRAWRYRGSRRKLPDAQESFRT